MCVYVDNEPRIHLKRCRRGRKISQTYFYNICRALVLLTRGKRKERQTNTRQPKSPNLEEVHNKLIQMKIPTGINIVGADLPSYQAEE